MFARTAPTVVPASTTVIRGATLFAVLLLVQASAIPALAQNTFVAPSGSDANSCLSVGTACRSIAAGISKAGVGATVNVAAGTYTEAVTIGKAVNLKGAQAGVSALSRTAGAASESILDVRGLSHGFDIGADNVTVDGFDIRGDASTWAGVRMFGTRDLVTIRNNLIHGMANDNPNSNSFSYSYGVWALGGGSVGSRGAITRLTVSGNNIYNLGGANLGSGVVSGGAGMFLFSLSGTSTGTGALVTGNSVSGMANGTHPSWPQPGLGVALMQDDDTGRIDSGGLVTGNAFSDMFMGVVMHTASSLVDQANSLFTDVSVMVKQLDGRGSVNEGALQPFNTRDDEHALVLPAVGISSKAYYPVNQTRYVSATGSDALNLCTDSSTPCRTIQWAVDRAFSGDQIVVGAGTFAESVTVDKAVSINGARAGVSALVRTAGAASESILDVRGLSFGFDIQSDDVTIDGFDIRGDASTWAGVRSFASTSGLTVKNNLIHGMSASNPNSSSFSYSYGVWLLGGGSIGNRGDISGVTIQGNDIYSLGGSSVQNGTSGGAGLFVMSLAGSSPGLGLTVTGNRFRSLPDGTHNTFGTEPGVGVAVLQDDESGTVDAGASIGSNTFIDVSVGVAVDVAQSSVAVSRSSFSNVEVFVLNVSSRASVNTSLLTPYVLSTSPSLGLLSAPTGSVAYFANAQSAFDNSAGAASVQIEGNLSGVGTGTSSSITLDGAQLVIIQNGVELFRGAPAAVAAIVITGTSGDDTLEIDLDLLAFLPPGGIQFNGGSGFDSLVLSGGSGLSTVQHTFVSPNDGSVLVDGQLVAVYTGLDPITDSLVAVNRIFTFTAGAETVVLSDDGAPGNGFSFIDADFAESVTFRNPTGSLVVNLGSGNDTINMTALDSGLSVNPIINGGTGNDRFNITPAVGYSVTVNGDSPTVAPGDVLDVALVGTTGASLSNAGGSGAWTFTNRQAVTFTSIETQIDNPNTVDLALTKTTASTNAYPGDVVVFTLTVTNSGPGTASGILVRDVLPAALTCVCAQVLSEGSFSTSGGAGETLLWSGIGLAAGESATLQYSVTTPLSASGTATNTAAIYSSSPSDPNTSNNSASVTLNFERPIRFPAGVLVQTVAFYESSPGVVETLAGTFNQGLYRSLPSFIGSRWAPVTSTLPLNLVVNDLMVAASGTVYLGAHGYGGLYTSTDGGRSWSTVDFGGPTLTIIHALAESTVDGIIYLSADDGQVWRQYGGFWDFAGRLPEGSAHTPWSLAADPVVAGRLFAGTFGDGVYRSDDYGETWIRVSGGAMPNDGAIHVFDLEFDPELSPTTLWAGTSRGIYFSQDSGVTWTNASPGLGIFTEVRSIAFGPVDPSPTATGPMYIATWGGGVFEMPSNRATLPQWVEVTLRNQQVSVVAVSPDGQNLVAAPSTGGTVAMAISSVSTAQEPISELPTETGLHANYPNPFNPQTTIGFALAESGMVRVSVHDVVGRLVGTLVNRVLPAGEHQVQFNASDLPSGPYIYRLETEAGRQDRVMVLLK